MTSTKCIYVYQVTFYLTYIFYINLLSQLAPGIRNNSVQMLLGPYYRVYNLLGWCIMYVQLRNHRVTDGFSVAVTQTNGNLLMDLNYVENFCSESEWPKVN